MISLSAGNPMRVVLMAVLIFEVIVFGLAVPVMIFNSNVALDIAIGFAGGAMVLALVAAGMLRKPAGFVLGWLTQVVAVALGALTPTMFLVGAIFAGLWLFTFVLGKRLDAAKETGPRPH